MIYIEYLRHEFNNTKRFFKVHAIDNDLVKIDIGWVARSDVKFILEKKYFQELKKAIEENEAED
jgi:fatty acid-binding protein DegV